MRRSLRSWIWRIPLEQEVDEEIGFHLDMLTRELVDSGLEPAAARRAAAARIGDLARVRRVCLDSGRRRDRTMRVAQWIEELRTDVRFALRQLRSAPVFAVVAAATLALGIGANSAIFALVDRALLRPLPVAEPERLVSLWETDASTSRGRVAVPNLIDWIDRNRTFEAIAGYSPLVGGMVMAGTDGMAQTVGRQWTTARFFDVVGVTPLLGRVFLTTDDTDRLNVVVLSEHFWRARFSGDRRLVNRTITLDGVPYTVVGVVPDGFDMLGRTDLWAMMATDRRPDLRAARFLHAVGRLTRGTTLNAASGDLARVAQELGQELPATNAGTGVALEPLRDTLVGGDLRFTALLFLGVVGFVLLLCCANVASLLLARATARRQEMAIRSALGAGRRRIVRQMLTESVVLSALGGALGVAVGALLLAAAPMLIPEGLLPLVVAPQFDMRVMLFCAAATLLVGLLFGVAPAWSASTGSPRQALASDSRTVTAGGRLRAWLVGGEVAVAVLLLVGAGLLLRTLLVVERADRGYRADEVLTMMVDPLGSEYPTGDALVGFYDAVSEELRKVSTVRQVAWTSALPLGPSESGPYSFEFAGHTAVSRDLRPAAEYQIVSDSYFETLDLPIVAGRPFSGADRRDTALVCIVNEAFVRTHFGGRSPLGARLQLRPETTPQAAPVEREIVGVARQVKGRPDEAHDVLQVYVPMSQGALDDIYLVVRPAAGPASAMAPAVRAAIGRIDRAQLVSIRGVTTLGAVARAATARHRFRAVIVMTFAVLALVLAIVGVFGMLAYLVQQRERDFAVRRALGATTGHVLGLITGSAMRLVLAGALVGFAVAALSARALATLLFGVQPLDPMTFLAVFAILALTTLLATVAPAWRASRINPAVALRSQ